MNVLVLGRGSMGRRHITTAQDLGHTVISYDPVASIQPDDTKHVGDIATHDEDVAWDRLNIGAVVIASPADQHTLAILRANGRGLPIFVEKPVATSYASLYALERISMAAPIMVGYNLRYLNPVQDIKDNHLSQLGNIRSALFYLHCDMSLWPGKTYGHPLLECSHEIDLACYLLGPVVNQTASAWLTNDKRFTVQLAHASGAVSTIYIETDYRGYERGGIIHGDRDDLSWSWEVNGVHPWRWITSLRSGGLTMRAAPVGQSYRDELQAFLELAPCGRIPARACSLREGLDTVQICLTALASTKSVPVTH